MKNQKKTTKTDPKDLNSKFLQKQEWMADNLYDHTSLNIWPPNFPDLNPLDYYVWSVVGKEVNEHLHNTKDSLKDVIVPLMSDLNKKQLITAWYWFQPLIKAVLMLVVVLLNRINQ